MIGIGCPIRDRDWCVKDYLKSIYNIDYDKKQITLSFLINDSEDNTQERLLEFMHKHQKEYSRIIVSLKNYGFKKSERDFGRMMDDFMHLAQVRNDWVKTLKDEVDYIYSIDSDILVPSNSLKKLIKNDKDICSILINNSKVKKGYGKDITNLFKENGENIMAYFKNKLFEVNVTGAAYLIKSKVLKKTKYYSHLLGEDFGFCVNARKNKFEVWCDSNLEGLHLMNKGGKNNG
jgi:hypothetical protein